MLVDPAWISSAEHLAKFHDIVHSTSLFRKIFLGYRVPVSFPSMRIGGRWYPIVHFSSGILEISNSGLAFHGVAKNTTRSTYRGVRDDLRFSLTAAQIKAVRWAEIPKSPIKYYTPSFIEVEGQVDSPSSKFFVCAGGSGPSMKTIRERTHAMFEELIALVSAAK